MDNAFLLDSTSFSVSQIADAITRILFNVSSVDVINGSSQFHRFSRIVVDDNCREIKGLREEARQKVDNRGKYDRGISNIRYEMTHALNSTFQYRWFETFSSLIKKTFDRRSK